MRCHECHAPVVHIDDDLYECAEDPSHEGVEDSPWSITSDALADWAMSKLAVAEQNLDRIASHYEYMKQQAEDFLERESKRFKRDQAFFEQHLVAYYEKVAPTLGKVKTYGLVNGEISSRQGSEVVEVDEPEAFKVWAAMAKRGDLLRVKVDPDKAEIKKALKAGEEIPGVRIERKPDEVRVRPYRDTEMSPVQRMPRDERGEAA